MSKQPLYCCEQECLDLATFMFEGNSVCDKHLVEKFKDTSLSISRIEKK